MPLIAALSALAGLVVGPLLGLVVDRAVDRERPEPHLRCATCGRSLGRYSLIPVVAWFTRCPVGHRSWRYPLVDLTAAVLFGIAGWRFGWTWQLGPYLLFFAALVVMCVIDVEHKLLLNILTYPTLLGGLFVVLALSTPNDFAAGIAPALWAASAYFGFFYVAHVVYPAGMGFGDVKLAPSLGLFIGWLSDDPLRGIQSMLSAVLIALVVGAVVGIALTRNRKAEVPFGPFMVVGAVAVIATTTPAGI